LTSKLFDPGLQPERTELAWRRTALAIAVGSLVAMRLLPDVFQDPLWVIPGVVGLVLSSGLWVGARGRYAAYNRALEAGDLASIPDGRLIAVVAVAATATGVLGLVVAVVATA
jgi:uncharacterized membrane protein YidH (DUF202 family)